MRRCGYGVCPSGGYWQCGRRYEEGVEVDHPRSADLRGVPDIDGGSVNSGTIFLR
jgi:hypothetical protein